jgi:light-regulated signal transduction histidine kinase (bacteriophytochrome)
VSSGDISRQQLAQLRHQLRTPLNHIIGYAEILLEDAEAGEAQKLLTAIHTSARQILDAVQQDLTPLAGTAVSVDVHELRERIQEPIQAIMRDVGLLVEQGGRSDLLDLLRINNAASELLQFALGQAPKSESAAQFENAGAAAPALTANVLLVDDDEANRDILRRQLQRIGCSVSTAEDGDTALRLAGASKYDVVLLDIVMPKMDGVATLKEMSRLGDSAPPVIMISAVDEMESVRKCLELGAEDYVLKPFDPIVLRSRLTAALDRARLRARERERTRALENALTQLREVNEDLQQFAFAASHDLQSPIRTVTAMSQLLARRYSGKLDADANQLIDSITSSMTRMQDLVQDLLAYSRLSSDAEKLDRFSLEEAFKLATDNLAEQIRASGAAIEHGPLPSITGRRTQFVQLFQNLVGNALTYRRPERPRVRVVAEDKGGECVVHVADNGIGFDPAYAERIFEPFKRLHGREYPGSGIGLAICARIVRQYGGRIWANSRAGEGSVFSFTIPADCLQAAAEDSGGSALG